MFRCCFSGFTLTHCLATGGNCSRAIRSRQNCFGRMAPLNQARSLSCFPYNAGRIFRKWRCSMFRISCLCLLFAGLAFGQEALPIYVSFEFQVPAVTNLFPPGRSKELESQIGKLLAESCAAKIPYWTFQTGAANAFPRLAVSLNEHADWSIQMALCRAAGQ